MNHSNVSTSVSSGLHCSKDMDLSALRQQILLSSEAANEKAEDILLENQVKNFSKDEWRQLIAGIPEDMKKEIGRSKPTGTQLHLHICLIVQGQQLAIQHRLVSQWRCLILQLVAWQPHCIFLVHGLQVIFLCLDWLLLPSECITAACMQGHIAQHICCHILLQISWSTGVWCNKHTEGNRVYAGAHASEKFATDSTAQQSNFKLPPALAELERFIFHCLSAKLLVTDSYNGLVAQNDALKKSLRLCLTQGLTYWRHL